MKKIYFLLVAMFVCMAANAQTYVNVMGEFNGWQDNGLVPNEKGITKHEALAIGTKAFKVKVYNGADNWYSTGGAIAQDKWVAIAGNDDKNMTIAGAEAGDKFDVEFNVNTNSIRVTKIGNGSTEPDVYTYGLYGNWDGGNSWDKLPLTETDGKWVSDEIVTDGCDFGIQYLNNGIQQNWIYAATENDANITNGNTVNVKIQEANDGGKNFTLAAGKYILTFDPEAMTLSANGEESGDIYTYGLWGNWDGGSTWSARELTEVDGKWVSDNLNVSDCSFGIKYMKNGQQEDWYSADGDNVAEVSKTLKIKVNGDNFTMAAGAYVLTIDPEAKTLTIEQGEVREPVVTYVLWNSFTKASWDGIDLVEENGKYVAKHVDVELENAQFGVKELTDGSQTGWIAGAKPVNDESFQYSISDDTDEIPLSTDCNNIKIARGYWNFTFDFENNTVVVENDYDGFHYVNIIGEFNDHQDNGVRLENGISEHNLTIGTNSFIIKQWDGKKVIYYSLEGELEPGTPAPAARATNYGGENWVALTKYDTDDATQVPHMTIKDATEGETYQIKFDAKNKAISAISLKNTGVEDITVSENAPVEYFNLQGIRVENPSNGLYIVKQGNKISKQVIR